MESVETYIIFIDVSLAVYTSLIHSFYWFVSFTENPLVMNMLNFPKLHENHEQKMCLT